MKTDSVNKYELEDLFSAETKWNIYQKFKEIYHLKNDEKAQDIINREFGNNIVNVMLAILEE